MKSNAVGWFEIHVADMARARAFYETVLGVELEALNVPDSAGPAQMYAFPGGPEAMQHYGANGALVKMDGVEPGGAAVLVYFACDDCAVEAGRVDAAGGKIHTTKQSIGEYGFIALVIDSEGNMVGLHSMQ